MEGYRECLVARERTGKDRGIEIGLIAAGVACAILGNYVTRFAFFGAMACVAAWFVHLKFYNVEYEYLLVEGSLSVDRILNRGHRKRCLEFSLKDVVAAAETGDDRLERLRRKGTRLADYSSRGLTGRHVSLFLQESGGLQEIRLTPDETTYKMIWRQLPALARRLDMI